MKVFFSILSLVVFFGINSQGGQERGGGDAACENGIKIIRDDIRKWILDGGSKALDLPAGVTEQQYTEKMLEQIASAKITCVAKGDPGFPVMINNKPKACRYDKNKKETIITCDIVKIKDQEPDERYVQIHHEFAGLAGLEVPLDLQGEDSSYVISNQISGFLANQLVRKLVVKPRGPAPVVNVAQVKELKKQCEESADKALEGVKDYEVAKVQRILSASQPELQLQSIRGEVKIDPPPQGGFWPNSSGGMSTINHTYMDKYGILNIYATTVQGVHLKVTTDIGTINPIFVSKSDSAGRPIKVSCGFSWGYAMVTPYRLINADTETPIEVDIRKDSATLTMPAWQFGGWVGPIILFKDVKVQN